MKKETMRQILINEAAVRGLVPVLDSCFAYPLKVRLGYNSDLCGRSIDELELSVRALNCLKRANVLTIDQLIDVADSDELLRIRNLGRKSYVEIRTKLLVYGYDALSDSGKHRFWEEFLKNNKLK